MFDRFLLVDKLRYFYIGLLDIDGDFNEGYWCFFMFVNFLKVFEDVCKVVFGVNKKNIFLKFYCCMF